MLKIKYSLLTKPSSLKIIFIYGLSLLAAISGRSQFNIDNQFTKSDAYKFENVSFFPVSEYTGKANITFPIFSIKLDGLTIPIELNYNSGGIKVNQMATEVGLGWELIAGGKIIKKVNGDEDNTLVWYRDYTQTPVKVVPFSGNGMYSGAWAATDNYDEFYLSAPGLNNRFIIDTAFHIKGLDAYMRDSVSFTRALNDSNVTKLYGWPNTRVYPYEYPLRYTILGIFPQDSNYVFRESIDFQQFNITNIDGFRYQFSEWEHEFPFSSNAISGSDTYTGGVPTRGYHSSYLLTNIISPLSNKQVSFSYDTTAFIDSTQLLSKTFDVLAPIDNDTYTVNDYDVRSGNLFIHKKIKKITSDEVTITFNYDTLREDFKGQDVVISHNSFSRYSRAKLLSNIEVRNSFGNLVNKYVFNYSYFYTPGCTNSNCKRLKLNSLAKYGSDSSIAPEVYSFNYYEQQNALPPLGYPNCDAWGYNNDSSISYASFGNEVLRPKLYFYKINGNGVYSPFNTTANPPLFNIGVYDKSSSFPAAQAWSLKSIRYPLGGSMKFEYEPNSFVWNGEEVSGGGIRIKKMETDINDSLVEKIEYQYTDSTGKSSGNIVDIPLFAGKQYCEYDATPASFIRKITTASLPKIRYTHGSEVGYSQVSILKDGIEKIVKEYINPAQVADTIQYGVSVNGNPQNPINLFSFTNDHLRGLQTDELIYKNNNLLQKTHFNYQYSIFDSLKTTLPLNLGHYYQGETDDFSQVPSPFEFYPYTSDGCPVNSGPADAYYYSDKDFSVFNNYIKLGKNNLVSITKTLYDDAGHQLNTVKNYDYQSPQSNLLTKEDILNSKGQTFETNYQYPFNLFFSSPAIDTLYSRHILSPKITTTVQNKDAGILEETAQINYDIFAGGEVLPYTKQVSYSGGIPKTILKVNQYNNKGQILEYIDSMGTTIAMLYGYNSQYPIAKIIGSDYNTINSIVQQSQIDAATSVANNDASVRMLLNTIRISLASSNPVAQVWIYTYTPLVGMTSETNPKGYTTYYEYDSLGRLIDAKDKDGNVIKKYNYHYQNQ